MPDFGWWLKLSEDPALGRGYSPFSTLKLRRWSPWSWQQSAKPKTPCAIPFTRPTPFPTPRIAWVT